MSGGVGDIRGILEAGRDCRYPGARRGISGIKGHWGLLGGRVLGPLGGIRECWGCQGCIRVASGLGANHIGPSPGPSTPNVPLGD